MLGVPRDADERAVAQALASLGNARNPNDDRDIWLWMQFAHAVQDCLVREGEVIERVQAAHCVLSATNSKTRSHSELWWDVFGMKRSHEDPDANPSGAISAMASRYFVQQLADAGCFRLLY